MRPSGRAPDQLRDVKFTCGYTKHAEGSVLVEFGETRVLCTASVENKVPRFLKGKGEGWVTAEYGMLPRSTHTRMGREASRGKQGGRTQEIQRLIGRSLRAAVNLSALGENTITIDCDVLQADGGTRTAAVTGGYVALAIALNDLKVEGDPVGEIYRSPIAAISVGLLDGIPIVDLDYAEDSVAEADINIVMNEKGELIEIQGTAEREPFTMDTLNQMLHLAKGSIGQLVQIQRQALEEQGVFL